MKNWVSQTPPKRLRQIHFSVLLLSAFPSAIGQSGLFLERAKSRMEQKSLSPPRSADGQLPLCFLLDVDGQVLDHRLVLDAGKDCFSLQESMHM